MAEPRKGRQTPTVSRVLAYTKSCVDEAVNIYSETGRTAQEWQSLLLSDILAVNADGLWTHTKYGYSVPRRNGKNEVVSMRELYALRNGEKVLHTAHRTTTSHSAAMRLVKLLDDSGYEEVIRFRKGEVYNKHYTFSKQLGLEKVTLLGDNGGVVDFRTRTSKGGLGEGFDLLVIDEAQEYTDDQESSLKYVVTDSPNPQTIFCGTPPTAVSSGTVFPRLRKSTLSGETENAGWAEWSVGEMTDCKSVDAWYECNPSLGTIFTERSIRDEIGTDETDFNIQRLGLWLSYSQKADISEDDWKRTMTDKVPKMSGKVYAGIKYGKDGTNCALSVACKTRDGRIFISAIDCRNIREGDRWIFEFLERVPKLHKVVVDGNGGRERLVDEAKERGFRKKIILPTPKEFVLANSGFEQAVFNDGLWHMIQPSLDMVVTHCQKRAIGNNGGFGYRSGLDAYDIALMDSAILAWWLCNENKDRKVQRISY